MKAINEKLLIEQLDFRDTPVVERMLADMTAVQLQRLSVQFWKRQTCKSKPDFKQHG